MINAQSIKQHVEVLGSDGQHGGAVDGVDGAIKLTKSDLKAGGQHHTIPLAWVAKIDTQVSSANRPRTPCHNGRQ